MNKLNGVVYLVGAGPGDPELITVKGLRLLQRADVVVYDRLVNCQTLQDCRPNAELIDVGKRPRQPSITQEQINQILIDRASTGRTVVRLKGGDPFVFGRGQEEMDACRAAKIRCYVVPGISSCLAAPASVGVPVTSRGLARSFVVLTGQTDLELPNADFDFRALASIDTVVFMMGHRTLAQLVQSLLDAGRNPSTPVVCVQNATTARQRMVLGKLYDIVERVEKAQMSNPMVTIIGDVASLAIPVNQIAAPMAHAAAG
jgi:uroporphyrin-III C-methyltransferase